MDIERKGNLVRLLDIDSDFIIDLRYATADNFTGQKVYQSGECWIDEHTAQFMLVVQTLINFFIPSATGQAAATMPIMAQLADIIGLSRQTAVLAFHFGDGLSNIFWPTADIVIICGLGGISLQKWYKWFTPLFLILFLAQAVLVGIAAGIGY